MVINAVVLSYLSFIILTSRIQSPNPLRQEPDQVSGLEMKAEGKQKSIKIKMYKNIILPVVLYGFEKGLSHKEKNKN
jgi:hypothetical protein